MVWMNAGGICERKTLFRMKKEADQVRFKGTRTGPIHARSTIYARSTLARRTVYASCCLISPLLISLGQLRCPVRFQF